MTFGRVGFRDSSRSDSQQESHEFVIPKERFIYEDLRDLYSLKRGK